MDANQVMLGGLDRRLQEGYPIKLWYPGEVIEDRREIPIDHNVTKGLVWLRIGGYQPTDDGFNALPLVVEGRESEETSFTIGPILIGSAPNVMEYHQLSPQTPLAIQLGQPPVILLHGYDLSQDGDNLQLTLYWENMAQTLIDWTIFVHLRNKAGKNVAQKDGPAGSGNYPTSLWQVDEIVADKIVIPIRAIPKASYTLFVGLYDPTTGQRLSVPNNQFDEIMLLTGSIGK
jgi:hypothetical protein